MDFYGIVNKGFSVNNINLQERISYSVYGEIVEETKTQTLTNKILTTPVISSVQTYGVGIYNGSSQLASTISTSNCFEIITYT